MGFFFLPVTTGDWYLNDHIFHRTGYLSNKQPNKTRVPFTSLLDGFLTETKR